MGFSMRSKETHHTKRLLFFLDALFPRRRPELLQLRKTNLLDLRPTKCYRWEETEDGRVVILAPKFRHRLLVKYLMPMLRSQDFKVSLDDYGSFVWKACDGNATVLEISERLRERYGEKVEPVYERVGLFIRQLWKQGFVDVKLPIH